MPVISGGGGNFNGGTITRELTVDRSGDTSGGNLLELTAENATAGSGIDLFVDAYGDLSITGKAGNSAAVTVQTDPTTGQGSLASAGVSFLDSAGVTLASLDARGVGINVHAAPADASLLNGECVVWFDDTNGASKLMIKAKSANGTVVTGSVTLA